MKKSYITLAVVLSLGLGILLLQLQKGLTGTGAAAEKVKNGTLQIAGLL